MPVREVVPAELPRLSYQKSLFDSAVIQLPMPVQVPQQDQQARRKPPVKARRMRPADPNQQAFSFDSQQQQQAVSDADNWIFESSGLHTVESVPASEFDNRLYLVRPQQGIFCDAPVAQPMHRLTAGALDFSMVFLAVVLFFLTFYLMGGRLSVTPAVGALCATVYAVLWFFYKALYSICGADTPGMIWTNLRLISFEGSTPDREQRIYRMFGGVLGFLSAGLGLVWSLVDEEQLTWHDHISKTFPSPVQH
ncbi:hypothetical protein F183_A37790 [Bryobacterales bacterium F-183]|nr:hypothetical protein F183_A37790 [Bryobacterales bacterium F-183]